MATTLNQLLSTFFLATVFLNFPRTILSDDNTCPYPCYPSPPVGGGGGGGTTPTTTPPPPPSQTGIYYPPPQPYGGGGGGGGGGGIYPYNPPPYGGGFGAPPPPDPILPYFPFYYRHPLHRSGTSDDDTSSASPLGRSSTALLPRLVFLFALCFYYLFY